MDPKPKAKKGKGKAVAGEEEEESDGDSSLAKIKSSGALFDAEFYRSAYFQLRNSSRKC